MKSFWPKVAILKEGISYHNLNRLVEKHQLARSSQNQSVRAKSKEKHLKFKSHRSPVFPNRHKRNP